MGIIGSAFLGYTRVYGAGEDRLPPPLLDEYGGATVAYSVRKLSSSSTYAMEVRRSSDSATLDIGFSGEDLDTTSLASFVGGDSAYVSKWYDQSGNNNHAIQSTTTLQPRIINAGVLETIGGLASIAFNGSSYYFDLTSNIATSNTTAWSWVFDRGGTFIKQMNLGTSNTNQPYGPFWFSDANWYYAPNTTTGSTGLTNTSAGQKHFFGNAPGDGNITLNLNSSSLGTRSYTFASTNYTVFGKRNADYANGKYQEFILWDSNESANQTDIESNTNTYYTIY